MTTATLAKSPAERTAILGLVGLGIVGVLILRSQRVEPAGHAAAVPATAAAAVPTLLELGSTSCRSCKAMHDELALLRKECGASIAVEEIDVWKDEAAAKKYGIRVIPTQVFVDASGRELERHTGFLARAEIRARFAARGYECRP